MAQFKQEEIDRFVFAVLHQNVPEKVLHLHLGAYLFSLPLQVVADPYLNKLVKDCQDKGARVYIISGSPQGVVESFCRFQGLQAQLARGARVEKEGRTVIPFGMEKVKILTREGITQPYMAFGNSIGDFEMLTIAENAFVRKNSAPEIIDTARKNHWELI
jgi:phosphoserine phosphatase